MYVKLQSNHLPLLRSSSLNFWRDLNISCTLSLNLCREKRFEWRIWYDLVWPFGLRPVLGTGIWNVSWWTLPVILISAETGNTVTEEPAFREATTRCTYGPFFSGLSHNIRACSYPCFSATMPLYTLMLEPSFLKVSLRKTHGISKIIFFQ